MSQDQAFIGIQIGGIAFANEGVENVINTVQRTAHVNALIVGSCGFSESVNRPPEGFADHGMPTPPIPDDPLVGSWVPVHPQYYGGTMLTEFSVTKEPYRSMDVLEMVLAPAHEHGMKVYSWLQENPTGSEIRLIPNFPKVLEVDIYGRRTSDPCVYHPDYRAWWLSIVEDQMKSYPIDGFLYNVERRGPLGEALTRTWGWRMNASVPTCFCEHCQAEARNRGINVERARTGYEKLWDFIAACNRGEKPVDGYLVTLLRLMLRYPEMLAWDQMWVDGMDSLRAELYGVVKAIDPATQIGWHIFHENTFSPLCRAEHDYARYAKFSDFIKPVVYNICAGIRFKGYIDRLHQIVGGDMGKDELAALVYAVMGWDEGSLNEIPRAGWSADSVYREIKRCVAAVGDQVPIYSGPDMDIPQGGKGRDTTPADVEANVEAGFRAGAKGLIISRNYTETKTENLEAVGRALNKLGIR